MDVSNWPPNKIMQLPDHMFGQRWYVGFIPEPAAGEELFILSKEALPEWAVIWALSMHTTGPVDGHLLRVSLRLGHRAPATTAAARELPLLLPGLSIPASLDEFHPLTGHNIHLPYIRKLVHSKGRRIVAYVRNLTAESVRLRVAVLVSGIPKEIPDELLHPPLEPTENYLKKIWERIRL